MLNKKKYKQMQVLHTLNKWKTNLYQRFESNLYISLILPRYFFNQESCNMKILMSNFEQLYYTHTQIHTNNIIHLKENLAYALQTAKLNFEHPRNVVS